MGKTKPVWATAEAETILLINGGEWGRSWWWDKVNTHMGKPYYHGPVLATYPGWLPQPDPSHYRGDSAGWYFIELAELCSPMPGAIRRLNDNLNTHTQTLET